MHWTVSCHRLLCGRRWGLRRLHILQQGQWCISADSPHRRHVLQHRLLCTVADPPRVCIVGSGPAGFYTAHQLLKGHPSLHVDIYEKLPVPYGLVRYGVAPDHPEVKNVIHTFEHTAENERCSFLGNVLVGRDVLMDELRDAYTAVVLAYGAEEDRELDIPGETLPNVLAARRFVGWYNGHPHDSMVQPNLDVETAVILGQGNVALDMARLILMPAKHLRKSDIKEYALDALSKSRIEKVIIVGRRGPLQVAFTIKELREMIKLPGCRPILSVADFKDVEPIIKDLPRPRQRLTELMWRTACQAPSAADATRWDSAKKQWGLRFLRSPLEILSAEDSDEVRAVRFAVNELEADAGGELRAAMTDQVEEIPCGLVLRSVGYQTVPIDESIPFNEQRGVIPNSNGRVSDTHGVYVSGWAGLGPIGVILTTMMDSFEVGRAILEDLQSGTLKIKPSDFVADLWQRLDERGVQVVTFDDWKQIEQGELQLGDCLGKPTEKITDIATMLRIAKE